MDETPKLSVKETKEFFGYTEEEWKEVERKDRAREQAYVQKQSKEAGERQSEKDKLDWGDVFFPFYKE